MQAAGTQGTSHHWVRKCHTPQPNEKPNTAAAVKTINSTNEEATETQTGSVGQLRPSATTTRCHPLPDTSARDTRLRASSLGVEACLVEGFRELLLLFEQH